MYVNNIGILFFLSFNHFGFLFAGQFKIKRFMLHYLNLFQRFQKNTAKKYCKALRQGFEN